MADSPNTHIPAPTQNLPVIVLRGTTHSQFQHDLNRAIAAGYEPEFVCQKGSEIWAVCLLREGDDPEDTGDDHRPEPASPPVPPPPPPLGAPPIDSDPEPPAAGNINEAAAAGTS